MGAFTKLSRLSRIRKWNLFNSIFKPTSSLKVLDVGGQVSNADDSVQFLDLYPWKENLATINISHQHITLIKSKYPQIQAKVCDACQLPWPDKHFDIVFSNAVIEHLASDSKQQRMAREITRVGKSWFVTTPNRLYPFEFHTRLPLVTWLPGDFYKSVGTLFSYNHLLERYMTGIDHSNLRLLTAHQLNRLFQSSKIIKQRITFMPETLIAVGPI